MLGHYHFSGEPVTASQPLPTLKFSLLYVVICWRFFSLPSSPASIFPHGLLTDVTSYSTIGKDLVHFSKHCSREWESCLSCHVSLGVMWIHKYGRGLEGGVESKRDQDAAVCSVRYATLCSSHPSHFPTCAWEYTVVAFSAKRIVCSVPSIWILFKWESNGPDCSKNTPEVLT